MMINLFFLQYFFLFSLFLFSEIHSSENFSGVIGSSEEPMINKFKVKNDFKPFFLDETYSPRFKFFYSVFSKKFLNKDNEFVMNDMLFYDEQCQENKYLNVLSYTIFQAYGSTVKKSNSNGLNIAFFDESNQSNKLNEINFHCALLFFFDEKKLASCILMKDKKNMNF